MDAYRVHTVINGLSLQKPSNRFFMFHAVFSPSGVLPLTY